MICLKSIRKKIRRNQLNIKLMGLFISVFLVVNLVYYGFQMNVAVQRAESLVKRETESYEVFIDNYIEILSQNLMGLVINFTQEDITEGQVSRNFLSDEIKIIESLSVYSDIYLIDYEKDLIFSDDLISDIETFERQPLFNKALVSVNKDEISLSQLISHNSSEYFAISIPYMPGDKLTGQVIAIITKDAFVNGVNGLYNYHSKLKYGLIDDNNQSIIEKGASLSQDHPFFSWVQKTFYRETLKEYQPINFAIDESNWQYKVEANIILLFLNFHKEVMGTIYMSFFAFFILSFALWYLIKNYERDIYMFFYHGYLDKIKKKYFKQGFNHIFAVIIDIDNFSEINKKYGYAIGDQVLTHIIKENQIHKNKERDFFYLGGDNFLLIDCCKTWAQAKENFERVLERFSDLNYARNNQFIKISFNFVLYQYDLKAFPKITDFEKHMLIIEEVMKKRFKHGNQKVIKFKNYDLVKTIYGRQEEMKRFIEKVILKEHITPYFQSIVDVKTNQPEKYEVLMRFYDEDDEKLLSPYPYIKVAEQFDFIKVLDFMLIKKTLKSLKKRELEVHLSFNLSNKEIADLDHIKGIINMIDEIGYNKNLITFEITETSKISNFSIMLHTLTYLKDIGIKIALDDFGTGHSNFEMIKNINAYCDYIKIDGLFIKSINENESDQFFVKSLVNLAKAYHMKVIAEYVETESIDTFLKHISVDLLQGYYYSKPVAIDALMERRI